MTSRYCADCGDLLQASLNVRAARLVAQVYVCDTCIEIRRAAAKIVQKNARYGIDYGVMFSSQEGRCKLCHRYQSELKRRLAVDHDHATGRVRGLLCHTCNIKVGYYEKTKPMFAVIESYLEEKDVPAAEVPLV
jgi:hypothetical protein